MLHPISEPVSGAFNGILPGSLSFLIRKNQQTIGRMSETVIFGGGSSLTPRELESAWESTKRVDRDNAIFGKAVGQEPRKSEQHFTSRYKLNTRVFFNLFN